MASMLKDGGSGYGDGSGSGDGYGSGSGYGYGYGSGSGYGYGDGDGSGSGHGSGDGSVVGQWADLDVRTFAPFPVLGVGCQVHTLDHWREHWREIARAADVRATDDDSRQIEEMLANA